jgi:hypothetical protein
METSKCKFCGIELTEENKYSATVCKNRVCIHALLKVCDDDCFNCKHYDCVIVDTHLLKD